jgi:hypothetical protein
MDDHPYTTADEDPFNIQPVLQQVKFIKHRRSSLLDKWILEQQHNPTKYHDAKPYFSTSDASLCNPYLAYPDLRRVPPMDTADNEDAASINSYDLVDDDDIPTNVACEDTVPQVNMTFPPCSASSK